jgi:2,5-diketo-D-gluconate reductase B
MTQIPDVTLKNRVRMPMLGLGTFQSSDSTCTEAVRTALQLGYRHIDTAEMYWNESEIRTAIKGFEREKLFLTSKVFHNHLHHDDVIAACLGSMHKLAVRYIDLYLIHWPNRNAPMEETFAALKQLHDDGRIRCVGVSNFDIRHLEEAMKASKVDICVDQVEFHPFLYQKELLEFCNKHHIIITAYSPLARGEVYKDKTIIAIGKKHSKTAGQVSLRWLHQKGIVVIPKASTEEHLRENLEIFDFELDEEDMKTLDNMPQRRLIKPGFAEFD